MTYNIPKFNAKISGIHDYFKKHEWSEVKGSGIFGEPWQYCSTCGLIVTRSTSFASKWNVKEIRPEQMVRAESLRPFGLVPSDLKKHIALYLFDLGWHVVDGSIDQTRLSILRSEMNDTPSNMRIISK